MTDEIKGENPKYNESDKELEQIADSVVSDGLKSILEDPELSEDKKKKIISAFIVFKQASFRGPIPPPEILIGYNEAVKDGAERIVAMAEKQLDHRIKFDDYIMKEELKQSRDGQVFGFILSLVCLVLAAILAMFGHDTVAGIFGTTTIIGLVTVFVIGKKAQQEDSSD